MSTDAKPNAQSASSVEQLGVVLREYLEATQRLQLTHESLEREVALLRGELASKDRELERRRRLASLGELAAGVAHEVRNPLGAIQLYSGLLRRECRSLGSALALIEKIDAGVQAIDGVVRDTLALAPRSCELAPHRLSDIVARARDLCCPVLTRHGVSLSAEFDDAEASLVCDASAIQRVLVNLIENAADFAPQGSAIRLGVATDGAVVRLTVADEGPGLAPQHLDRVFDPFFTTKSHGTGLGLTIAHRLVEAHGGSLTARNRPEGGAEFTITLPYGGGSGRVHSSAEENLQSSAA
ncbi:MAG TPA: ATP-binding protein [Phycisphaerae bacterium]|nr:ATP-binding protein [Phycisphaerae bacterium]